MILAIPDILTPAALAAARAKLEAAAWIDGRATAGHRGARVKNNQQLAEHDPVGAEVGASLLAALQKHPLFISAALPLRILPPLFNRYQAGQTFGTHVDGSIRVHPQTGQRIRTDLSCTFFFSAPEEYDGGELIIEDTYGEKSVKLPAGQLILYPSTSLHRVNPVTRGARLCAFFWLQSLIRDNTRRALLFDMDVGIQRLAADTPEHPGVIQLTGVYHNLLRQWAET